VLAAVPIATWSARLVVTPCPIATVLFCASVLPLPIATALSAVIVLLPSAKLLLPVIVFGSRIA
jgi:hypothetical protein